MFSMGLDLGKSRDPSTIVIVEGLVQYRSQQFAGVAVRHLERIPLGTPYPLVVDRVRRLLRMWELTNRCGLAVDGTGVGIPVLDMLRAARLGCEILAITITGGNSVIKVAGGFSVPKRDLLAEVQVLLEKGELRIAKGLKEGAALMRELMNMKFTQTETGRTRMGADGYGEHDDLVIALALACWRAKRRTNFGGRQRLPGL